MTTEELKEALAAIEHGFCHCGCGGKTSVAQKTAPSRGYVKGEPLRFIVGHHISRKKEGPPVKYVRTEEQKRYNSAWRRRWWAKATDEERAANTARKVANNKARHHRMRRQVLEAYGGKCACCGETEDAFLTLDHVNNDGKQHRIELGQRSGNGTGTASLYHWCIKNDFPATIQILCWNCNHAKEKVGICPHQKEQ